MMFFLHFFEVSWLWTQFQRTKLPNLDSVDDFASLDTPWGPGGIKVVDIFVFEKYFRCWRHLVKNFVCFKLKPDVSFIILHFSQPQQDNFQRNPLFEVMIIKHSRLKSISVIQYLVKLSSNDYYIPLLDTSVLFWYTHTKLCLILRLSEQNLNLTHTVKLQL